MRTQKSKSEGKKEYILSLRQQGLSYGEIVKRVQCSKGTVSYHLGEGQREKTILRNRKLQSGIFRKVRDFAYKNDRGGRGNYKEVKVTRIGDIRKKARCFCYGYKSKKKGKYQMNKNNLRFKGSKVWSFLEKVWPGICLQNKNVQSINQWTKKPDTENGVPVMYPMVRCKLTDEIVDAELSNVHCDHADGDRTNNDTNNFTLTVKRFNEMKGRDSYEDFYKNCKKFVEVYEKYNV